MLVDRTQTSLRPANADLPLPPLQCGLFNRNVATDAPKRNPQPKFSLELNPYPHPIVLGAAK